MNLFRVYIFAFLVLALPTIISANDGWLKIRSEHFSLVGNASEQDIRQTAVKLEKFREVFTQTFPDQTFNSPIPTNVIVFKTENLLDLYKANNKQLKDITGYFLGGEEANYIVVSEEKQNAASFQNIYHQYAHFLTDNAIGKSKIPAWFYEGLAEYFEDFQIDENGKTEFGNLEGKQLELIENNQVISFEIFLNIDFYTLRQQERAEGEGLFYAQARALTNYLMQESNRPKLHQLMLQISSGKSFKEAFLNSFQIDYAEFEKVYRNYIKQTSFQNSFKVVNVNLTLVNSTISEPELHLYFGDLLYNLNRFEEAENHFENAIKLQPNLSLAISALGLVRVSQFKYDEANILAKKAIEIDDQNYLNYFRYAYILSRRGMTEYGFVSGYNFAEADKMRDALKKAISLNPDFAESYNLLALISFVRNDELDESLQLIEKALQIAPGNQQYLIRFAELSMRKERFLEARKTTLAVLQTASEPGLRLYAQNTLQRIDSTEAQLMRNKRDKDKYVNDESVTDEPMSDEEITRRRAKAVLDSIRSGLRKPLEGQKRIGGKLIEIECQSKQMNFVFKTEKETIKLRADSLEGINLMTFNQNMYKTEIGCGVINRENNAVIIYREMTASDSQISGEILSIEFVPKEFKLAVSAAKP